MSVQGGRAGCHWVAGQGPTAQPLAARRPPGRPLHAHAACGRPPPPRPPPPFRRASAAGRWAASGGVRGCAVRAARGEVSRARGRFSRSAGGCIALHIALLHQPLHRGPQAAPLHPLFGITSNTLVRSSQRPYMGRCGCAPTAAGAMTAGPGCRYHRHPGELQSTAPILPT